MKKLLLLLPLLTGCLISVQQPAGRQTYNPLLQRAEVRVVNNCAPYLDLETPKGAIGNGVPLGGSYTAYLTRNPLEGNNLPLIVKGRGANGEYLGSYSREFYVDDYNPTRQYVWEVNSLQRAGGGGGCLR